MAIILRTPDKKIKLQKQELHYLIIYLDKCKTDAFTGVNSFRRFAEIREKLLHFSLTTLIEKALHKHLNNTHSLATKKITIAVNVAEETALIICFQRVGCDPYTMAVQQKILMQLRPLKSAIA